jgi:hypothetical protein
MRPATATIWACLALVTVSSVRAESVDHDRADAQALDLARQAIALRSVRGPGLSHGLNERMPVEDVRPSISYMLSLFTDLSK